MTIMQAWLLFGLPALVLGLALFVGRSPWRSVLGYVVLLAGFGALAVFDRASAAIFGSLVALLYAAGRGGQDERAAQREQPADADVPGWVGSDRTLKPGIRD